VELRAIALKLVSGAECDTLLKIANQTINAQKNVIRSMQTTIDDQEVRFLDVTHLADQYNAQKEAAEAEVKTTKRKLVWTKIGWAATGVVLTITTVLALLH